MPTDLKRGREAEDRTRDDRRVRGIVEGILSDIEARGHAAVREASMRFDQRERGGSRLTGAVIRDCLGQSMTRDLDDIAFAQAQSL